MKPRPLPLPPALLAESPGAEAMALSHPSAFVRILHQKLLASPSATAVLREVYGGPVEIERLAASGRSATEDISGLLDADGHTEIIHRQVLLRAAGAIASEADLYYIPSRLFPGMARTLLVTNTPFGTVVAPMQPTRETIYTRFGGPDDAFNLVHHAVLKDRQGAPIACVFERYLAGSGSLQHKAGGDTKSPSRASQPA